MKSIGRGKRAAITDELTKETEPWRASHKARGERRVRVRRSKA